MYKYNHWQCGGIGFYIEELPLIGTRVIIEEFLDLDLSPFIEGLDILCCTCGEHISLCNPNYLDDFEECSD